METNFVYLSGNLCIDFVNTQIMSRGELTDLLHDEADLWLWFQTAAVFDEETLSAIADRAAGRNDILDEARQLRQHLRAMIEALANGRMVTALSLKAINAYLNDTPAYHEVRVDDGEYISTIQYRLTEREHLFYPIAEAARILLSHSDHTRIRQCDSSQCILYFYDSSKNGLRRWCSMQTCGNRRKARRHYHRQHD